MPSGASGADGRGGFDRDHAPGLVERSDLHDGVVGQGTAADWLRAEACSSAPKPPDPGSRAEAH